MNNLFNQSDVSGILARIDKLTPNSQRQWGKMNVGQCTNPLNIGQLVNEIINNKLLFDIRFQQIQHS
ncbi:MAG: hypothetical protein WBP08_03205 [Saprospiraceae bacterium]